MKDDKLTPLQWMTIWFITFKLGEIGKFGNWTWFEIFSPLWVELAGIALMVIVQKIKE
jgi:hypothetical protein